MKTKLNPETFLTPEKVDAIHLQILTECPIYSDRIDCRGFVEEPRQILKSSDLYLCSNEALCRDFYAEANKRLRESGLKKDMPDSHCPALVAENLQMQLEHKLVEASGRDMGVTVNTLLCARHGLENLRKWLDLVIGLVVNAPDFKNPLTS